MCPNSKIIINPALFRVSHIYHHINILGKEYDARLCYFGSKNRLGRGHYPYYFMAKNHGVTLDNFEQCVAYDDDGTCIPFYIAAPCGHCPTCIVSHQINFGNRLMFEQYGAELNGTPLSYFVTLTYNNKHLPKKGVCKLDCQLFLKRLRKYLDKFYNVPPFRFCLFSEYGKDTHRPHYHLILFGVKYSDSVILPYFALKKAIEKCWQKGFIHLKLCHEHSFSYLSKYMLKGSNVPEGKNPNFKLSSNRNGGMGCSALIDPEILKQLSNPTDLKVSIKVCGKVRNLTIPREVASYFYRECDLKYRSLLSEHVFNMLNSLKSLLYIYKYDLTDNPIDFIFNYAKTNLQHLNIKESYLEDCLTTSLTPKFIEERFPFLYDIYSSLALEERNLRHYPLRDTLAIFLTELDYLQNFFVELSKISENSIYLRKLKNIYRLYEQRETEKDSSDFRNHICSLYIDNFNNRNHFDFDIC